MDKAVTLQTPILKSARDRLKELQDEHGHESAGETIGWLIEEVDVLNARNAKLIEDAQ